MKVSIVTLSYNQAPFLEEALRSVLNQSYADIEYIVVDPGSTDGSRDIIERYRHRLAAVIFEPDQGAADGLNKGFSLATGDVFGFLNADDVLTPSAVAEAVSLLKTRRQIDVISGHCAIIDANGRKLRRAYSDRFSLKRCAYGTAILIQPSTWFRAQLYREVGGFRVENRSNWDGELFIDMALAGAHFGRVHRCWSAYRVHAQSITGSFKAHEAVVAYHQQVFQRIMGRHWRRLDDGWLQFFRLVKYLETPASLLQRLWYGPVYGSADRQSRTAASLFEEKNK
jgi:glycosyltransferase involved in cell wall biosynthesis